MNSSELLFASRPSIDFAFYAVTGQWLIPLQQISCPFPGHDDYTPSFNLFDADETGTPQSFGCFGCDKRGDVMQLLEELTGLRGQALLIKAEELAHEEAESGPDGRRTTKTRIVRDFGDTMLEIEQGITDVRLRGLSKYLEAKGLGQAESFARETLGWAPSNYGTVAVPHRDSAGSITGIKYRTLKRKWSADGSSWPALYGTWLDRRHGTVILCEGESDMLWASWWLRGVACDVLALPSGASAAVTDDWVERVRGRRLFLLFDADQAGRRATAEWTARRPDAYTGRLPEGEDLLSCGIPVLEVLQEASST